MKQALDWPRALVLVTLTTVFSIATAADTTYRWVDADGNVHYSDQAPPANAKEVTSIKGGGRSSVDQSLEDEEEYEEEYEDESDLYAEEEAEFQERRIETAEAEAKAKKEADIAAQWNKNCDISRKNLEILTNPRGGRVREVNADGVLVYVPEEERQRQKAQAAEDVKKWCKG